MEVGSHVHMPDRTVCVHCGVVGFVRRERVIQGQRVYADYYCGHCEHGWQVAEENERRQSPRTARRRGTEPPDRSRSRSS